ncbi:DUF3618 domain-containing protein [Streptomyces sp. NPDC003038]|uniref:DUF3618 domain-containing protein n=1 Tax=unclassified Streptomyces TaxID=2593676 RepID=UPI0033B2B8EC
MTKHSDGNESSPTPEQLREQIEHTRAELTQAVEALAAKVDVTARAQEKTAAVKEQAGEKAVQVTAQVREMAAKAATTARANRTPLLAAGIALVAFLLIRRSRRRC